MCHTSPLLPPPFTMRDDDEARLQYEKQANIRVPPSNLGCADRMDPLWDRGTIESGSGNIFHLSRVGPCLPVRSYERREADKHGNEFTQKHD